MKKLLLILLIISPMFSYADSIHYGIYTTHFEDNKHYNNINHLIALEFDDYMLASFTNSYKVQTYAAGKIVNINKHVSIIYGASYGYNSDCVWALGGSHDKCRKNHDTKELLPFASLKLSTEIQSVTLSAMFANYASISVGFKI